MKLIQVIINAHSAGLKIDKAILENGVELSRKELRRILDKGGIQCNGKRVFVASQTVKKGDVIRITWHPALSSKESEAAPIQEKDILYWDHEVIAVNKAPGVNSVPTVSAKATFVKKLLLPLLAKKQIDPEIVTACHRLDKETSGILLFALGQEKANWIMQQFKDHSIRKVYHALCYGIPKQKRWEVNCHLSGIDKRTGRVKIVRSGGYSSFSSFEVLEVSKQHNVSLIRIEPRTGRSHQIRIHLLHSQHPIIGDKSYTLPHIKALHPTLADLSFQHHFLHASQITFKPEEGQNSITLTANFPPQFEAFLKQAKMTNFLKEFKKA